MPLVHDARDHHVAVSRVVDTPIAANAYYIFFNSSPDAETHIYTGRSVFPNSAFFVTVEKNPYFYTRVAINR